MDSYPSIRTGYAPPPIVPSGRNFSIAAIAGRSRKGLPYQRITIDEGNLIAKVGKGIPGQPEVYDLFAHVNTYKTNVAEFVRVLDILTAKFPSLELKLDEAVTGTVVIAADSPNMVGTGTDFAADLVEGGVTKIGGILHEILTITDGSNAILAENHVAGVDGATITKNEWVTRADTYDTTISLVTSGIVISLNDGSDEDIYGVTISDKVDLELTSGVLVPVFTITFHKKVSGVWGAIEKPYQVSLDPNAKNDLPESLYLPAVLNSKKSIFKALTKNAFVDHAEISLISTPMEFLGATAGDAPGSEDFQKGWDLFSSTDSRAMLGAIPNNDQAAAIYAIKLLYDKDINSFYNIPGALTVDVAVTHLEAIISGVGSKKGSLAVNYGPLKVVSDPFHETEIYLDWAGAMTGACAFGDSGDAAAGEGVGIHSQPAGTTRGLISVYGAAEPKYTLTPTEMTKLGDNDINFIGIYEGAVMIKQARTQVGHNVRPKDKQVGVSRAKAFMLTWFRDYLETVQHESDAVTEKKAKRGGELLSDLMLGTGSVYLPSPDQVAAALARTGETYTDALTTTFVHNDDTGLNDIGLAGYIMGSSENFQVTVMSI